VVVKEMQIKTIITFHLILIRMATSRAITTTNAGKDAGKKEPLYTVGGNAN
jgi:hypothetical protein